MKRKEKEIETIKRKRTFFRIYKENKNKKYEEIFFFEWLESNQTSQKRNQRYKNLIKIKTDLTLNINRHTHTHTHIHTHTHTHTHIYIYIYIYNIREREAGR